MTARLFVAVDLPETVRGELAAYGRSVADADPALRAVDAEALHATLAFLGTRDEALIEPLAGVVRAVAAARGPAPVALALGAALWLAPRRPHVLTIELADPTGALEALQTALAGALSEAIGWEPERRRFRPHVTVARVRRGAEPRRDELPDPPRDAFDASTLTLYRSRLSRRAAHYEVLARAALQP